MGGTFGGDAKEYSQFCRFRRLFLVDGLEAWRMTLKGRRLSEVEITTKMSAAADLIRRLGEP